MDGYSMDGNTKRMCVLEQLQPDLDGLDCWVLFNWLALCAWAQLCTLYKTWGEGGSGLLLTGNVQVGAVLGKQIDYVPSFPSSACGCMRARRPAGRSTLRGAPGQRGD